MSANRDLWVKWSVYGIVSLLLMLLHALFLRGCAPWGAATFLPPLLAGVVASLEETRPSVVYALVLGIACDLTVAAPFPCLYTLAFPAAAFISSLLAKSVLQPGVLCSLVVSVLAFAVTDCLNILALALRGERAFGAMGLLALRETALSCLLLLVCHPLLTHIHRKYTL